MYSFSKIRDEKLNYTTIKIDNTNTIWLGTTTGLYCWRNSNAIKIPINEQLYITCIESIGEKLLIGTKLGHLYLFDKTNSQITYQGNVHSEITNLKFTFPQLEIFTKQNKTIAINFNSIKSTESLNSQNGFTQLVQFENDSIIVLANRTGELKVRKKSDTTWITFDASIWNFTKINDLKLLDKSIAVATDSGAYLFDFKGTILEQITKKNSIQKIEIDKEANIWFCGVGFLASSLGEQLQFQNIDLTKLQHPSKPTTQDSIFCYTYFKGAASLRDSLHQLWIQTKHEGLYCVSMNSIKHINDENGILSNTNFSMFSYGNYLLITSSKGLSVLNILNFSTINYTSESLDQGLSIKPTEILKDSLNQSYIETSKGTLQFYVPTYKQQFQPQSLLSEIQVMDHVVPNTEHTFNSEENYFKFKITSVYNGDELVYYRYTLKGINTQWINTAEKSIVFPRLQSGHYEFILQVANNEEFSNATEQRYYFFIENPFWKTWWFISCSVIFITFSIYHFMRFREQRISREQTLEKEKAIAEFETLKQQVSPHFLFNSFNTLIQVIDEDKEKAIEYTQMLSDFYRSLISYRHINLVPLSEEYDLLLNYMYLQKMRFDDSLKLTCHITPDEKVGIQIPPLTLQLLAENAIKHNTISSSKLLEIELFFESNYLCVRNNINEKLTSEAGEKIGLQNIKNRFNLVSKTAIEVYQNDLYFEVKLPILKSE